MSVNLKKDIIKKYLNSSDIKKIFKILLDLNRTIDDKQMLINKKIYDLKVKLTKNIYDYNIFHKYVFNNEGSNDFKEFFNKEPFHEKIEKIIKIIKDIKFDTNKLSELIKKQLKIDNKIEEKFKGKRHFSEPTLKRKSISRKSKSRRSISSKRTSKVKTNSLKLQSTKEDNKCIKCSDGHCNKYKDILNALRKQHYEYYPTLNFNKDYNIPIKCSNPSCELNIDHTEDDEEDDIRNNINYNSRKDLYLYILKNIKNDKRIRSYYNNYYEKNKRNISDLFKSKKKLEYENFIVTYSKPEYLDRLLRVDNDALYITQYYDYAIQEYCEYFKLK